MNISSSLGAKYSPVQPYRIVKRYSYVMTGQVIPPNAPENILIEYGVVEGNE